VDASLRSKACARAAITGSWAVCALWCCAAAAAATHERARMERAVELRAAAGQFMGAVLVARDGRVLLSKGYGDADLDWKVPNSPTTKFRLGSITKQFTAACILLLEERGKLSSGDPVKKHLADAPAAWDAITIFNLLTHTAGIPNFTDLPDYRSTETRPATPEELVARFRDQPLDFAPGAGMHYSNSGYVLLGYLIEKVSGQSYQQFLQDNIFTPLAMKDSGYEVNRQVSARRAVGYSPSPKGPVVAEYIDMSIPFAAGGLYSTTEDLLRWEQGLFGGKVLSAASLAKMATPFKEHYAFGLAVNTAGTGEKLFEHGGGVNGFNTRMLYVPEQKLTVIVLANLNGPAADNIATDLRKIALHEQGTLLSDRVAVRLAPAQLRRVAGPYRFEDGEVLIVSRHGDHLETEGAGPPLQLYAESALRYFARTEAAHVAFEPEAQQRITGLTMERGALAQRAVRIDEAEARQLAQQLAKKVHEQLPSPGTEAALRRSIAEVAAGNPDYQQMGPGFAAAMREQLPRVQQIFKVLGAIEALKFTGVDPQGSDQYHVSFEHGAADFVIRLGPDGKIVTAAFQPSP
jgi:CubicO group peptidase (beta-lactamase class C family)